MHDVFLHASPVLLPILPSRTFCVQLDMQTSHPPNLLFFYYFFFSSFLLPPSFLLSSCHA